MSKRYGGLAFIKDGSMDFEEILLYFSDSPYVKSVLISEAVFKNKMKRGKDMSKITNNVMVDLRKFTPEALSKIDEIANVVDVILPKNMSCEFAEAYGNIKKSKIVQELYLTDDQRFCTFNGNVTVTENDVTENTFLKTNGVLIVRSMPEEMNISVMVNGLLVKTRSSKIKIEKLNGLKIEIDDDASIISSVQRVDIDKCFIESINNKTAIIGVDRIEVKDDVTVEMLKSKGVFFGEINTVLAPKALHGYIQANSVNLNTLAEDKKKKFLGIFSHR